MQVNYINAHATSTLVGDVAEVKAIKKVFTDMSHVKVNGTKSLIGHCLGAAGGLEAVATIQAIRTGWLHPTLNQVRTPAHFCKAQRFMPVSYLGRESTLLSMARSNPAHEPGNIWAMCWQGCASLSSALV